jgi:hypothetical protein
MGLGSEIRKKPIPDPGVKKAPDPGSGSATMDEICSGVVLLGLLWPAMFATFWSEDSRARTLALGAMSTLVFKIIIDSQRSNRVQIYFKAYY